MISKHVIGRLGNQMFQYATVRAFQEKYRPNDEILLDFSEVYSRDNCGYKEELGDFNIKKVKYGKLKLSLLQKILNFILLSIKLICLVIDKLIKKDIYNKLLFKIENNIQPFLNKFGLYSFRLGYYNFKNSNSKNVCFYGTFESSKYFDNIKEKLQEEFTPKYGVLEKNKELYEKIYNTNSVCITIRRGDFVTNLEYKKNLYVCDSKYFENAIKIIQKKVKNPYFFIFSDDINWVKENMKFPKNIYFETGDDPVWEKLRLMYSCKHFIISNSTFSWWAQYLSRNKEKIVVAPSRWGNQTYKNNDELIDIYEKDWILVDV